MKNYTEKKQNAPSIMKYKTTDGHTVLCGRNNIANDYLTTKMAQRWDWWFHVKNQPGSHVVLVLEDSGEEPSEQTFTEAAEIAAYNSKAKGGVMIPSTTQERQRSRNLPARTGICHLHHKLDRLCDAE